MTDFPAFLEILSHEAKLIEDFVLLLEQEKILLIEGRTEALAALIEKKEALAGKLNDLTQQRSHCLLDGGFSPDREGMDAWARKHPQQKEALAVWERALSLAAQAREQNRINGQLVDLHRQHTSEALKILLRKESRLDLYGPDGRSRPSEDNQIDDTV
jgi:flagellar biosynthesis/type III secretory pathway chaperone